MKDQSTDIALVVFHGKGAGWWRWLLADGFAHCFVVCRIDGFWIAFDPHRGVPSLRVVASACFDLAEFYHELGYSVVETPIRENKFLAPILPATCVAVVKRVIGLRALLIITPWQLFRRLGYSSC
jgi:hypothetical protein